MKTVLVTEDNTDMLEIIHLVLKKSGYRLLNAPDGKVAVEMCLKEAPDLVLMDLNMAVMNGYEATATLRKQGFKKPIVVLTASESEADRKRAMQAGCNEYILKTLDMAGVERVIDHYLRESGGID